MKLQNPWGLLFLLAVPVLILIWLIRPRYAQHRVSSGYLWKKSLALQKKREASSRIRKLLPLVIQCLTAVLFALLLCGPTLMLGGVGQDRIILLDTSASMRTTDAAGVTRFDRARRQIRQLADENHYWSAFTIITCGPEAAWLTDSSQSLSEIGRALDSAECTWASDTTDSALAAAALALSKHPGSEVLFYTDRPELQGEGITIVRIGEDDPMNAAVYALTSAPSRGGLLFSNRVIADRDAEVTLALYINDALTAAQTVTCPADTEQTAYWQVDGLADYDRARVVIRAADSFAADNEALLYNPVTAAGRVLLCGTELLYWEKVLAAFDGLNVTVLDLAQAPEAGIPDAGYDLYLYQACLPESAPADGAVWYIAPPADAEGLPVSEARIIRGGPLKKPTNVTDPRYQALQAGLTCKGLQVLQLRELAAWGTFSPVLVYDAHPAVLAGTNADGIPRVVFTFDLQDSTLPLLADFVVLTGNLLGYSIPSMLPETAVATGTSFAVRTLPLGETITLQAPDGAVHTMAAAGDTLLWPADRPGVYTLRQTRKGMAPAEGTVTAAVDPAESCAGPRETQQLTLAAQTAAADTEAARRGVSLYPYLAGLLMLLLVLEGVIYHRERV